MKQPYRGLFLKDSQGNDIFYPREGIDGYVLSDPISREELGKALNICRNYFILTSLVLLVILCLCINSKISMIFLLICVPLWLISDEIFFRVFVLSKLKNLENAPHRMKQPDAGCFRKDLQDNDVYYPKKIGKGYIISNPAKREELVRALNISNKYMILSALFIVVMIVLWVEKIIPGTALLILASLSLVSAEIFNHMHITSKLKGLKKTPHPIKIKDFIGEQIDGLSSLQSTRIYILFFMIAFTYGMGWYVERKPSHLILCIFTLLFMTLPQIRKLLQVITRK